MVYNNCFRAILRIQVVKYFKKIESSRQIGQPIKGDKQQHSYFSHFELSLFGQLSCPPYEFKDHNSLGALRF